MGAYKRSYQIKVYREFCNKLVDSLEELTGFRHKITSAYHPQLDERFNQTLKHQLQKLVNDHQDDWNELLDITSCLPTEQVVRTQRSALPSYLCIYGRETQLPIDLTRIQPEDEISLVDAIT